MAIYEEGKNYTKVEVLAPGTYENCIFNHCQWQEANLTNYVFTSCEFNQCDLTLANVNTTTFNEVIFAGCRLSGIRFDQADQHLFDVAFKDCAMPLASFVGRNLTGTAFRANQLKECDFTECNLTDASFEACNLEGAIFKDSVLENTAFHEAEGVELQLDQNRVKGASFRADQLPALVQSFGIQIKG